MAKRQITKRLTTTNKTYI